VSLSPLDIVAPSAQDAAAIASILYRASAAAYTDIVPPGFLWNLEETLASCQRLLNDPTAIVLAAVSGNQWLGFSAVLVQDAGSGDAELRRLYVIPERWGEGIGNILHDAALQSAQRVGATTASLWVLEKNKRARAFYEHRGWQLAASAGANEHGGVVEVQYERALVTSSLD
jgi:GNAT superfamily N-acetyltransferase